MNIAYYDPAASRMRADTLDDFLKAPLTGDLVEVPGIGNDTKQKLQAHQVLNTHQLIGVYLREGSVNAFYTWLQAVGVRAHRNTVVRCISEKTQMLFGDLPPSGLTPCAETVESAEGEGMEGVEQPLNVQPVVSKNARKNARKRAQKKAKKQALAAQVA